MFPAVVMLEPEVDLHEGTPLRPLWLADEMHPGFAWRPVGLPRITRDAGADDIFPCRRPAPIPRNDVVEIQIFAIELAPAELAGVLVALENVVACELHFFLREAIKEQQQNHPWDPDAEGDRVNAFWMRLLLRKVVPLVEIVSLEGAIIVVENYLSASFEQQRERPAGCADINRLPEPV